MFIKTRLTGQYYAKRASVKLSLEQIIPLTLKLIK